MSDETWQAVEDAISAHVADEHDGAISTHWVVAVAAASREEPDATHYCYITPGQPIFMTMGLLDVAQVWHRNFHTYGEEVDE